MKALIPSLFLLVPSLAFGTTIANYRTPMDLQRHILREIKNVPNISDGWPSDWKLRVRKIQRELREQLRYQSEPENEDFYKTYAQVMKDKGGDCEDLTIYVVCRLLEEGFGSQYVGFHLYWHKIIGENGSIQSVGHAEPLLWVKEKCYVLRKDGKWRAHHIITFTSAVTMIIRVKGILDPKIRYVVNDFSDIKGIYE